jgi:RimJ/RimL family protein N-acetyltransferase
MLVSLTPYHDLHFIETVKWLTDPEIKKQFGLTVKIDLEKHISWVKNNSQNIMWAILCSGLHIGNIVVIPNVRHHSGYLQIYIGEKTYHGRGIGFISMQLALENLFNHHRFHRIWLHCAEDNPAALSLYKKIGFVFEGVERECVYYNEIFRSLIRMSILKSEWIN